MFIDFEKFPFKITNVNFDEDSIFDDYHSIINIKTNPNELEACKFAAPI